MKNFGCIIFVGFLFIAGWVFAESEPVKITALKVSGDTAKKITYIEGNVRIVQGQTLITTEYVTINLDQKIARLDQGVLMQDPDIHIKSTRLEYNLKEKTGTFRKQVVLKRLETEKNDKDPFELSADELYFETDSRNFKARRNCYIKHQEFEGKAAYIEYDDAGQKLSFTGNVVIEQDSTIIRSKMVVIDLRKKELQLDTATDLASREIKVNADALTYDYQKKAGRFKQKVVLERSQVKDSKGKVSKEPFKLTADELYFETDTNNFMAEGGRIDHQEFAGTAAKIGYNDEKQQLSFAGGAVLNRPQGDELRGDLIEINLQEQSFMVHKNGNIRLQVQEDE